MSTALLAYRSERNLASLVLLRARVYRKSRRENRPLGLSEMLHHKLLRKSFTLSPSLYYMRCHAALESDLFTLVRLDYKGDWSGVHFVLFFCISMIWYIPRVHEW